MWHGWVMLADHATCYRSVAAKDRRFDGYIFTGVKTTGIYCRPICPARLPKSENVVFYQSAAAAQEAGFRPCLRCRPETAPDTPAWRGTSATIGRALRLIEEGALDEGSVDRLAMRLGLGDRQLRRLFLKHIGATPIAVAQTRRILLAKQLLHETRLPMAQVALGAGFGSIRRFNEVFQVLFGRPPSEVRRGLTPDIEVKSGDEIALKLRFRAPYDWDSVAGFLKKRLYYGVEAFVGQDYYRTFCIDDQVGTLRVGPGGPDWLNVHVRCASLGVLSRIIAHVRRVFDLDCDPSMIAAHLSSDAMIAHLVTTKPGLRLVASWSGFEGVVRAILGQQVTVEAGVKLGRQLVEALGQSLPEGLAQETGLHRLFPEASVVAAADLSFMKMPAQRQRTVQAAAQAFVDNIALLEGDPNDVRARLTAIQGIGPWTVDYVALRVLRDPDVLPRGDVALKRAFANVSDTDMAVAAEGWRPWRSYATQYLWETL
jgi:AraC family transcriptional regulator, regulatory protein of adaptative response / DNA-3-methyladenine glycosylase II